MLNFLISINDSISIFLIVLGIAVVIGVVAIIIYKIIHPKLKEEKKIDEEKAVIEELNRVLEPIDDEELSEQIQEYKDEIDEKK